MKDRAYEIAINPKYDGYQRWLANMVYKFFKKKTGSRASVNEELTQEFYKPVIKNWKEKKSSLKITFVRFKDDIWTADWA